MVKILVVEDELSIQKLLKYDLTKAGYEVDTASDGLTGYQLAKNGNYDLMLLDLMLPKMEGMEVCRKLRLEGEDVYIIILTALDDEIDKITGLEEGADDYITKPFSPREVIARIKAGLRRKSSKKQLKKSIIELMDIKIDTDRQEVFVKDKMIELTHKEYQLLIYLVENKGRIMSRDILLESLWGFSYDGDTRIVDVHIFKLRDKLESSQIKIKTKRGVGYMLEVD